MFDITIEQKTLMKALEYLSASVGKDTQTGNNCVFMRSTGNGSMQMYTTNGTEFIGLKTILASGGTTQDTAPYVDYKRLKTIISSIPSTEYITLKTNTGNLNQLDISFALKKAPVQLIGTSTGMIGLPGQQNITSLCQIPTNLMENATNNITTIVTDNASTPIYNCMRIETSALNVEITAVDITGKRTAIVKGSSTVHNGSPAHVLVEASKMKKAFKIFEDYTELEFTMDATNVWITARDIVNSNVQKTKGMIDDIVYCCRRLSGAFPGNISSNLSPYPTEFAEINKQDFLNIITRIKGLSDSSNSPVVSLQYNTSDIEISYNSVYGKLEESIALENPVNNLYNVSFKYDHLNDIINALEGDTFYIAPLPNYPTNYMVKGSSGNNVFTITCMAAPATTP